MDEDTLSPFFQGSGVTISEDDKYVYIEAAVPGLEPNKIEVTYDKGVLWIRGADNQTEQDNERKYYRRAVNSFSYRLAVPGEIDEQAEPEAVCKNGVMRVTFTKLSQAQPKKLAVKFE